MGPAWGVEVEGLGDVHPGGEVVGAEVDLDDVFAVEDFQAADVADGFFHGSSFNSGRVQMATQHCWWTLWTPQIFMTD